MDRESKEATAITPKPVRDLSSATVAAEKIDGIIIADGLGDLIKDYCEHDPQAIRLLSHPGLTAYWERRIKDLKIDLKSSVYRDKQGQLKQPLLAIFAGEYCYILARLAYDTGKSEEYNDWLQRGKLFDNDQCERVLNWDMAWSLNQKDCAFIEEETATAEVPEEPLNIDHFLEQASYATRYHPNAGLGMVAQTATLLAQYYQKKFPTQYHQIDRCYLIATTAIRAVEQSYQGVDVDTLLVDRTSLRNRWLYAEMVILENLKNHCEAILKETEASPQRLKTTFTI